jgi:hypothetical protein
MKPSGPPRGHGDQPMRVVNRTQGSAVERRTPPARRPSGPCSRNLDWRWKTGPVYPGHMPDAMIDEEIFRLVLAWAADQPRTKARGLSVWEISDQLTHRVVIPAVKRLHQARLIEVSNDATVVLGLTAEGKASAAR